MMRNAILIQITFLISFSAATSPANIFSPFSEPFLENTFTPDNETVPELELLKRQNNACPSGWQSCAYMNAPGLCCRNNAICQQDYSGHVACCPQGAVCTGTIAGTATASSGTGVVVVGGGSSTTTTNYNQPVTSTVGQQTVTVGMGGAAGTGTSTSGIVFVQATGGTQSSAATRSYVSNPYYPYPFIPTTYANAASCSHAYSTCQSDFASCTQYLGGSVGAGGFTISAPNGMGTTVPGPTTTYASSFAQGVCSSLSSSACYGLIVEACGNFGTGAANAAAARCTGVRYGAGVGVGVAVGLLGFR